MIPFQTTKTSKEIFIPEPVLHQQVIIFDRNHKCIKSTITKVQAT